MKLLQKTKKFLFVIKLDKQKAEQAEKHETRRQVSIHKFTKKN